VKQRVVREFAFAFRSEGLSCLVARNIIEDDVKIVESTSCI